MSELYVIDERNLRRLYHLGFIDCMEGRYNMPASGLARIEYEEFGSGTCELEPLSALDVTLNMLDQTAWGVCSECGTANPMDATFCRECWRKVKR